MGKDCQAGCPTLGHVCGHLCLIEIGVSSVFLSASGPSWIASHVKSQDTFSVRTAYQIAESQLLIIHYTLYNIAVEHYYSRGGKKMLLFLTCHRAQLVFLQVLDTLTLLFSALMSKFPYWLLLVVPLFSPQT